MSSAFGISVLHVDFKVDSTIESAKSCVAKFGGASLSDEKVVELLSNNWKYVSSGFPKALLKPVKSYIIQSLIHLILFAPFCSSLGAKICTVFN